MPPAKKLSPVPKPPKVGRETSWGMLDIMAIAADNSIEESKRASSNAMKARTKKMAARATTSTKPPTGMARESSWGCVDVLEMLDLENEDGMVAPPMPSKGSLTLNRSTSRGKTTTRPAVQAPVSPKRLWNLSSFTFHTYIIRIHRPWLCTVTEPLINKEQIQYTVINFAPTCHTETLTCLDTFYRAYVYSKKWFCPIHTKTCVPRVEKVATDVS